ncbi:MAG: SagB/ThcOx family dehydrogenase [Tepidisphaeraceae bacterium]|jgi:SagB-type dehydrogenase family enzyme
MSEQEQQKWPAMRMYHEASNLGPRRMKAFVETIVQYSGDFAAGKVPAAEKVYPTRPHVKLPPAPPGRGLSLQEALRVRRTRRQFSGDPTTLAEIAGLLRGACGITGEISGSLPAGASAKLRAWPSAGGLYPIELYLLPLKCKELSASVYHHGVTEDSLVELGAMPAQVDIEKMVFAEGLWRDASLLIVLTGVFERTAAKYADRGYRFVHQEAGHIMQNLLLMAEELQMNAVALGGFFEDELARVLGLESGRESPIYAVILGRMKG